MELIHAILLRISDHYDSEAEVESSDFLIIETKPVAYGLYSAQQHYIVIATSVP